MAFPKSQQQMALQFVKFYEIQSKWNMNLGIYVFLLLLLAFLLEYIQEVWVFVFANVIIRNKFRPSKFPSVPEGIYVLKYDAMNVDKRQYLPLMTDIRQILYKNSALTSQTM